MDVALFLLTSVAMLGIGWCLGYSWGWKNAVDKILKELLGRE